MRLPRPFGPRNDRLRAFFALTALCGLSALPLQASELRLEFVPTQMSSWQNFMIVNRLAESVFDDVSLKLEIKVPKAEDIAKLSQERQEELKAHLAIHGRFSGRYRRFCAIESLAPMALPWEQAAMLAGIETADIESALKGEQAKEMLNGASVAANRHLPENERRSYLIEAASTPKPAVEVIVINAAKYAGWAKIEPWGLEALKRLPFEISVKELDASTGEGLSFLKEIGFPLAPVVVLRPLDQEAQSALKSYAGQGALEAKGKNKDLFLARSFSSSGVLWAKKESSKKDLQLFIMSQCPYGVEAQRAILEAQNKGQWPQDAPVVFRFIVNRQADAGKKPSFASLHGASELEEDIRQMVLQKFEPEKFPCYLAKRLPNIDSSLWNESLQDCGVDPAGFQKLFKEKAGGLLEEDFQLSQEHAIRSSPTFLWRGRYVTVGLDGLKHFEEFKNLDLKSLGSGGKAAGKCQ
ncbi:MAG: hypothetical protein HY747_07340 [Elusimicrobia bacterium]|nr:hypothetical protein [Elusimicrobiota bacterium]